MLFLEGIPMRESLVANHHDQGRRQDATAIIECFSVTHTSKNFEGAGERLCSLKGGACAAAQWHNGQSKPGSTSSTLLLLLSTALVLTQCVLLSTWFRHLFCNKIIGLKYSVVKYFNTQVFKYDLNTGTGI